MANKQNQYPFIKTGTRTRKEEGRKKKEGRENLVAARDATRENKPRKRDGKEEDIKMNTRAEGLRNLNAQIRFIFFLQQKH